MAKLAAQLKNKFIGLVGRFAVCGRAGHKDAVAAGEPKAASSQHVEIRSRGGTPRTADGSKPPSH
ncbi:uncharacterized protein LOC123398712 [Hordeum vulgare subsp. vulgare]|uniref:Predicted protein n=1 Tax=Hordeum vulgare subsp. vulgare TaxID=112509 RepID=F2DNF9_HORVV|nr:uncharacterized protein LOC123398712 [Hordeum vulgare subsp. vulgare]KAI4985350.1 hypothetical protein ZWY2020_017980 [Hordeum vulgare]BAJ96630.1 predicted protein [Hordeum vulgare subsp. vulgare]